MADSVRYDHSKQQWHVWDGMRWAPDKTGRIYEIVRQAVLALMEDSDSAKRKVLTWLFDRSKKESVLKSMATRPMIAMKGDEWDPDPTLVAFTNGVLDLKTMEFNEHPSPDLLLSRSTRQRWNPEADPKRFKRFLSEVMGGDAELVQYLALTLGYAMFGWQREQKFWMWVGQGQNGKGTLAKTVTHALGDYADTPSAELYMRTRFGSARSDAARPDLLRLQGVRFSWMSEPSGGQFQEEMLKAHTGDDPIQARDLYGKASSFTTFRPTHTIIFLTNNPPRTEDVGPSMQRRVRIVKFEQDFRGRREDKGLEETMKAEAEGILVLLAACGHAWWSAHNASLPEPEKITEWSREYIEENDPLSQFIAEACVTGREHRGSATLMWAAYQDWCVRRDQESGSMSGFGMALSRRFRKERRSTGMFYAGIKPKSAMEAAEDDDE